MTAVEAGAAHSRLPYSAGLLLADRFILRRQLACGGSGEVWVASNRTTGGAVAIKLVRASSSALNAARFRQEAALSAALSHRNIVRVFDFFDTRDGTLGLVMECLRGETARERLERVGPFTARAGVALVTQALAGLRHAHDLGIVHRDIKPPNLFLATDPDGSTATKILDFGIAHMPSNTVHTLHGQLLGTPRYMSPEQIRHEGSLDGRSDVFSVAVVLYELLTGRSPFAAPFPTASLAAVLEVKVERDERIPPALWDVLGRALSKDRDARPSNGTDFADALRAAVETNDGVLARELHRSRPPPPLFVEETNGPVILHEAPPAPGPREVSRATRVRRRAWRIALGVTAVSMAILAVAAIRAAGAPRIVSAPLIAAAATVAPAHVEPAPASAASVVAVFSPDATSPKSPDHPRRPLAVVARPAAARAAPVRPASTPPAAPTPTIARDPGF